MKIKAVVNVNDPRQETYIRFLEKAFPEIMSEENPDMYYVLGGDGAMLHAHKNYKENIPFFGKGLGTANFLTNSFSDDFKVIDGLLNDTIKPNIIETVRLRVNVNNINYNCINDVIIGGDVMDWNSFTLSTSDGMFDNIFFKGLGLCLSTPLGSTAFNYNNGGKVLPMNANMLSVTSIVSNKNFNELIVPQEIKIVNLSERSSPTLYVDGVANSIKLCKGDEIIINVCESIFRVAFLDLQEFYSRRMKLINSKIML